MAQNQLGHCVLLNSTFRTRQKQFLYGHCFGDMPVFLRSQNSCDLLMRPVLNEMSVPIWCPELFSSFLVDTETGMAVLTQGVIACSSLAGDVRKDHGTGPGKGRVVAVGAGPGGGRTGRGRARNAGEAAGSGSTGRSTGLEAVEVRRKHKGRRGGAMAAGRTGPVLLHPDLGY